MIDDHLVVANGHGHTLPLSGVMQVQRSDVNRRSKALKLEYLSI
jgi:hypothetical protein